MDDIAEEEEEEEEGEEEDGGTPLPTKARPPAAE